MVYHAVDYQNNIWHAEDQVPNWCSRTVEESTCGAFDLLNATFSRVLIMFVGFRLLAPYPIIAKKLAYTTHKLVLCIIIPDVDWYSTNAEAVFKELENVKSWLE